ncbi:Vacuolar protein sorting-associated protein 2 1 [Glycine max]|nr:Vacuolar protein sorting-associated protein 2 1 [Glycine max]
MLDKSIREIERERLGLQNQKKLIVEIKKNAKQAQMGAVRMMAKDLIRTRHQIEKLSMVDGKKALPYKHVIVAYGTAIVGLPSQIAYGRGVEKCHTLKSTQAMGEATKGITKAMGQMNRWTADEFAFCTEDDARV